MLLFPVSQQKILVKSLLSTVMPDDTRSERIIGGFSSLLLRANSVSDRTSS
jgi:hypothetical protein